MHNPCYTHYQVVDEHSYVCHNSDLTCPQVVVLIDEYDTPLNKAKTDADRDELQKLYISFFTVLKGRSADIRLTYVTGIKWVGLTGIYGGANHLADLTYEPEYMALCGATEAEVQGMAAHYSPHTPLSSTEVEELQQYYGGYSWDLHNASSIRPKLYNAYSMTMYFSSSRYKKPYWTDTGPTDALFRMFPKMSTLVLPLNVTAYYFQMRLIDDAEDQSYQSVARTLVEAGYATISRVFGSDDKIEIDYANDEIRQALSREVQRRALKQQ